VIGIYVYDFSLRQYRQIRLKSTQVIWTVDTLTSQLSSSELDGGQGRRQRGAGGLAPNGGSPKKFSHNNGSLQMPPGLPEFIMGSYYYQRSCNLLQMHRPRLRRGVGVGPKSSVRKIN